MKSRYTDKDYAVGQQNELKNFKLMCENFDNELKHTSRFSLFDYESENTVVELKTRKCMSNTYPTTIVGTNKFDKLNSGDDIRSAYFVFEFIDGIYYWKYDKGQLDTFEMREYCRTDRGRFERRMHYSIPIKHLVKIT